MRKILAQIMNTKKAGHKRPASELNLSMKMAKRRRR